MRIKTILVDDESHAREKLSALLKNYGYIEILATCKNGLEAINTINEYCPELVFLDIEMPEIDGFRVIDNIECEPLPYFIFVTAYSEYAVKAFEVEALDYIHKPLDEDRLQVSLNRFLKEKDRHTSQYDRKIKSALHDIEKKNPLERFIIKKNGEYFLINSDDVLWMESDGNYVRIVTEEAKYFIRHTLSGFEECLDPSQFYRISRSVIVNIDWIIKIEDHNYGNYLVHMKNDTKQKMSKNYKSLLQEFQNF